jgi:ribosomal protein L16 Arg81 hydroxylase
MDGHILWMVKEHCPSQTRNPTALSMKLSDVFGSFSVSRFIDEYLHRLPSALPEAAVPLCQVGSRDNFNRVLAEPDLDLLVVRQGQRYGGPDPRTQEAAWQLVREGYTILVRHVERHQAEVAELAQLFKCTFQAPVNVHIYATPGAAFGFSWHYDAEDVFIVQTTGEKEYSLRKNTVNTWPLEETLPVDMKYERELMPLMRVLLQPGDLLYIPCGYWHRAQTPSSCDCAISLAIGVMSRAAISILDSVRPQLVQSLLWRQRLPVTSHLSQEQAAEQYRKVIGELAADLGRTLAGSAVLDGLIAPPD